MSVYTYSALSATATFPVISAVSCLHLHISSWNVCNEDTYSRTGLCLISSKQAKLWRLCDNYCRMKGRVGLGIHVVLIGTPFRCWSPHTAGSPPISELGVLDQRERHWQPSMDICVSFLIQMILRRGGVLLCKSEEEHSLKSTYNYHQKTERWRQAMWKIWYFIFIQCDTMGLGPTSAVMVKWELLSQDSQMSAPLYWWAPTRMTSKYWHFSRLFAFLVH